jgi:multiple antibiotic resistance protein
MIYAAYFEFFIVAFSAMFVIINPLTVTFLFLSVLPYEREERQKFLAWRAFKLATSILIVFALLGGFIFQFLGITLGAFKVAGGIILFTLSMRMIGQNQMPSENYTVEETPLAAPDHIAIMPLAIPFLSGPGSITTVMILTANAITWIHMAILVATIIIVTYACYFTMTRSKYIVRFLGETGKEVLVRLFGLILAVLAVQFVIDGITEAIHHDFAWLFRIIEENGGVPQLLHECPCLVEVDRPGELRVREGAL